MYLVKANDARTRLFIMTLEDIFTLENLNEAFYASSKISHWKDSTQRYNANLLLNNIQLREDVLNGEYRVLPTQDFILHERGKVRQIKAPSQQDRVVQKVLCSKIFIPQLTKPLIYDNYASLKDRGTSFARQMFDAVQDLVLIKGLLGHESLNTTSEYVKKTQTVAMQKYAFAQSW